MFERTHTLEFLPERCAAIDAGFTDIGPSNLTDYGVQVRYPGDFPEPSMAATDELMIIVNQIREKVMTRLSGKS